MENELTTDCQTKQEVGMESHLSSEYQAMLGELKKKAAAGIATGEDRRAIFRLLTLLGQIPSDLWWQAEA